MLSRINYHLTGCDFALSDLPAVVKVVNTFGISLAAYETELTLLQSILRDSGLLAIQSQPVNLFFGMTTSRYRSYNRMNTSTAPG